MFSLNQKVVYPGHGVASISRIFERSFGANKTVLFELKFVNKDMTVMVPKDRVDEIGVRPLSSIEHIETVFMSFAQPAKKIDIMELTSGNWNKRSKEYLLRLQTGSLSEISSVYRDLKEISKKKELSFGEKTLLQKTEVLITEEVSAAEHVEEDQALEKLRSFFVPSLVG